jgi:hypothetical protein
MDAAQEVKSRLDVADIVGEYLPLKPAGTGSFKANCPFHNEKTPSFYVNRPRQSWHCFGCDKGGDLISFVMAMEGLEFPDALQLLAQKSGVILPAFNPEASTERKRLQEVNEMAAKFFRHYLLNARDGGAAWQYINATPGSGNTPPALPTTSDSHWKLVAKDGVDGSGAVNSVNGQTGDFTLEAGDIPATDPGSGYTPGSANVQGHLDGIAAAIAAIVGAAFVPAGRLTLTSGVPVLSSGVSGAGTVYYTPYAGGYVPLYDGSKYVPKAFTELSNVLANSSTGKAGPAAGAVSSNYDLFVWDDAGTIRLTRGPAWTSATARGTGAGTTELVKTGGFWLNAQAITNGPAASRGTYVGTIRTNSGAATVDFSFGGSAAGGTAAGLNVWNCYNRVAVTATVQNSTASWTYNSGTPRQPNASSAMRVSFVSGLAEESFNASYACLGYATGTNDACLIGVMYDVTNAFSGASGYCARGSVSSAFASYGQAALGYHFVAAGEACNQVPSGTDTWYGSGSGSNYQNALVFNYKM